MLACRTVAWTPYNTFVLDNIRIVIAQFTNFYTGYLEVSFEDYTRFGENACLSCVDEMFPECPFTDMTASETLPRSEAVNEDEE